MNERKESTTSIILEYVRVIVLTVIATFIFLQFVQISRVAITVKTMTLTYSNIIDVVLSFLSFIKSPE